MKYLVVLVNVHDYAVHTDVVNAASPWEAAEASAEIHAEGSLVVPLVLSAEDLKGALAAISAKAPKGGVTEWKGGFTLP